MLAVQVSPTYLITQSRLHWHAQYNPVNAAHIEITKWLFMQNKVTNIQIQYILYVQAVIPIILRPDYTLLSPKQTLRWLCLCVKKGDLYWCYLWYNRRNPYICLDRINKMWANGLMRILRAYLMLKVSLQRHLWVLLVSLQSNAWTIVNTSA